MPLPLIYQDDHLLVLDKPTGLLAVPGRGPDLQDCLSARVQAEYPKALIVHRLDRDTSGLMIMARDPETHRQLSRLFENRLVEKTYTALVRGRVEEDAGEIDLPLRKDMDHPPRHRVDRELGKPALTKWRVAERLPDRTRLTLEPLTGRSHQLRVHLKAIGHPILGDALYADPVALIMADHLTLHAERLCLTHPVTGERMEWAAPCPF
ncbi:MAG: RluA family pseudouridine synthase [Planctomycetota bacterium]|jgi:tRNA pseudouridine32 synthase/23S rRNA pseudouridine746 synthase